MKHPIITCIILLVVGCGTPSKDKSRDQIPLPEKETAEPETPQEEKADRPKNLHGDWQTSGSSLTGTEWTKVFTLSPSESEPSYTMIFQDSKLVAQGEIQWKVEDSRLVFKLVNIIFDTELDPLEGESRDDTYYFMSEVESYNITEVKENELQLESYKKGFVAQSYFGDDFLDREEEAVSSTMERFNAKETNLDVTANCNLTQSEACQNPIEPAYFCSEEIENSSLANGFEIGDWYLILGKSEPSICQIVPKEYRVEKIEWR